MVELTKTMRRAVAELCREHHVSELLLFGSAARDDFDPRKSDLDFLVEFEADAEVGFLEFAALQRKLSEQLERKVDLVPKKGLKARIRDRVLADARLIYAR